MLQFKAGRGVVPDKRTHCMNHNCCPSKEKADKCRPSLIGWSEPPAGLCSKPSGRPSFDVGKAPNSIIKEKSPAYSLSDSSEYPAHWLGGLQPDIDAPFRVPVRTNAASILINQI